MKTHLYFPPPWSVTGPIYLANPLLTGYLRSQGFEVVQRDLNNELWNYVVSADYLRSLSDRIEYKWRTLSKNPPEDINPTWFEEIALSRALLPFVFDNLNEALKLLAYVGGEPRSPMKEWQILASLSHIISSLHPTTRWDVVNSTYTSKYTKEHLCLDSVHYAVYDDNDNVFLSLIREISDTFSVNDGDLVGISLATPGQLVPGLTLARVIKEQTPEANVVIGGPMLPYLYDALIAYPAIFSLIDFAVMGEGEIALAELITQLQLNCNFNKVSNLLWLKNNSVTRSPQTSVVTHQHWGMPDFSDYDFKKYLHGSKILPYLTGRGCYWKNCAFCSLNSSYDSSFRTLPIDRVVDELFFLQKTYGAEIIDFVDEVFPPNRLKQLSKSLIDKKVEIHWNALARLEKTWESDNFQLMYEAGCRLISFGLEAASQKVLDYMRKGINIEDVPRIIKSSHEAGIWNNVFLIFGFPSETDEDVKLSIEFLDKYASYIDSVSHTIFRLEKCSAAYDEADQFGIEIESYSPTSCEVSYRYKSATGLDERKAFSRLERYVDASFKQHYFLDNVGLNGIHIIRILSKYPKYVLRQFQLKNAEIRVNRQTISKIASKSHFQASSDMLWSEPIHLDPEGKKELYYLGFLNSNGQMVVVDHDTWKLLNKPFTYAALKKLKGKNWTMHKMNEVLIWWLNQGIIEIAAL